MTFKETVMDRALMEALEAIQRELRKIEFYGQAAEDNLERLQGSLTHVQHMDVDRLDHSIQLLRNLTRTTLLALEAALKSGMARRGRSQL